MSDPDFDESYMEEVIEDHMLDEDFTDGDNRKPKQLYENNNNTKQRLKRKIHKGKICEKFVEDKLQRQKTFWKRKNTLLKMARMLHILTGAEVHLTIVSSSRNRTVDKYISHPRKRTHVSIQHGKSFIPLLKEKEESDIDDSWTPPKQRTSSNATEIQTTSKITTVKNDSASPRRSKRKAKQKSQNSENDSLKNLIPVSETLPEPIMAENHNESSFVQNHNQSSVMQNHNQSSVMQNHNQSGIVQLNEIPILQNASADDLFFASLSREVQILPMRAKSNLKLKILGAVNESIMETYS